MEFKHKSVLLNECIQNLDIKPAGIYVDGTLGGGGHSYNILKHLSNGVLIGIDRDEDALNAAKEKLSEYSNFIAIHDNNSNIIAILKNIEVVSVDGILLDLGVSSYQLDEASRGFSYMKDAPLDMRMNKDDSITAFDVVNTYSQDRLRNIFFDYGEEKFSKRIAENIVLRRANKPIKTTLDLVDVIKKSMPSKALNEKQHPAKRVFQAIRIEVNEELTLLKKSVQDSIKVLKPGGRIEIITFHSLEDKIVKHTFEEMEGRCTCPKSFPICVCNPVSYGKIITKKPIIATSEELEENPRARSAKLRVFEKI
ncbi:MAG: 16S rRNA (cytosine(1402)-N(4))-methyltransferase RsmH [Clostridia bacterium]